MTVKIEELKKIRNYFLEHDKTTFEHHAHNFLNDLIDSLEISNRFEQQVLPTPEIIRERILQRWDIQDLNKDQRNMLRGIVGTIDTFINKATLD